MKNNLVILNTAVRGGRVEVQTKLGSNFTETVRVTHRTYNIPHHEHNNESHHYRAIDAALMDTSDIQLS